MCRNYECCRFVSQGVDRLWSEKVEVLRLGYRRQRKEEAEERKDDGEKERERGMTRLSGTLSWGHLVVLECG